MQVDSLGAEDPWMAELAGQALDLMQVLMPAPARSPPCHPA